MIVAAMKASGLTTGVLRLSPMERLRYSDRKRMTEQGSLGPLEFENVPEPLRRAVASIYQRAARVGVVGGHFDMRVSASCEQHLGTRLYGVNSGATNLTTLIEDKYGSTNDFLDIVEILAEEASKPWTFNVDGATRTLTANDEAELNLNAAFARHRFGYRLANGDVRRVGSPALDEAVVGPALIATARPGWEEADRSYRDALHHRRGGAAERGAAITDAHAALESAMKAAGFKGDTLAALAKSFRNSGVVLPQLEGVPDALDKLLKRSQSVRDSLSDAHGRDAPASEVPAEVVDLAIHWTGAFILYLTDAVSSG